MQLTGSDRMIATRRLLGLVIVLAVPALVAVLTVRPGGGDSQTVRVQFDELNGLAKVNRDVRISGVNVGSITEVTRVGDDAELTLSIDPDAGPVYQDATAELRPHAGFEGDAYVDLHVGTPGAGRLGDHTIPKAQTSVYVPLDRALRFLDAPRRDDFQQTAKELARASTPPTEQGVQGTLRRLPGLTRDTVPALRSAQGPTGDELRSIVRDLSVAMPVLGRRADRFPAIFANARRTLAAVRTDDGQPLDRTLAGLPGAIGQLRAGADELPGMFGRIRVTSRRLQPTLRELPSTLRGLRPVLREAAPTLAGTPELTAALQPILDDLAHATPATRALVAEVLPIVAQIQDELVPRLEQPTRVTKIPVYQALLGAFTGAGGATMRFTPKGSQLQLGSGHNWRIQTDLQQAVVDSPRSGGKEGRDVLRDALGCRARVQAEAEAEGDGQGVCK